MGLGGSDEASGVVGSRTRPPFEGRVALVTGSTRGIGRSIAALLVEAGAAVAVHGTRAEAATRAADEVGAALGVGADLADLDQIGPMVERVESDLGAVDILVNNAGISIRASFLETGSELWERTLVVDLRSPIELLRATLPGMVARGWGRVLNVASAAGVEPTPQFAAYATAKGGLIGLTLTLAAEMQGSGVRVNALSPIGMTDMLKQLPPAVLDDLVARGVPTAERCAHRAWALLSDDAPTGAHELMSFGEA